MGKRTVVSISIFSVSSHILVLRLDKWDVQPSRILKLTLNAGNKFIFVVNVVFEFVHNVPTTNKLYGKLCSNTYKNDGVTDRKVWLKLSCEPNILDIAIKSAFPR